MRRIAPSQRLALAGLYADHIGLRTCLDGILQGRFGQAWADSDTDAEVAALEIGPFTYLGGDAGHPLADELIGQCSDFRVFLVADAAWREKITTWENSKTTEEKRYAFSHGRLDRAHLEELAARIPDEVEIGAIDLELAERIGAEVSEDLIPDIYWRSPEEFVKEGFGYCALAAGRIEGGVTSALCTNEAVGIQINTNDEQRGKGIATVLGAVLLLDCLDRGIEPHWDTGSSISYHLAEKLGYELIGEYQVLEWEPLA